MKSQKFNDMLKEALKDGIRIDAEMKSTPRETDIVGYTIKYSDGSIKELEEGVLIYKDNSNVNTETHRGIAMEFNSDMSFNIEALMCHAVSMQSAGLNAKKIVADGIKLILNKEK